MDWVSFYGAIKLDTNKPSDDNDTATMRKVQKMIEIEKDVALQPSRSRRERVYPWLDMRPGDSFTVDTRIMASAARNSFRRYQSMGLLPPTFVAVIQKQEGGEFRCWLTTSAAVKKLRSLNGRKGGRSDG